MIYDKYVNHNERTYENSGEIDGTSSPKMFYTPNELRKYNTKVPRMQIAFISFGLLDDGHNNLTCLRTTLNYTKIIIKNAKYNFVFVQDEQIDLFKEMYFGEKDSHDNRTRC